jgi:Na+/H+ antiporter NhaD/arsenite permease-like protein
MNPALDAGPMLLGVPLVLFLFGATLAGIVVMHRRALELALVGLVLILGVRLGFSRFDLAAHVSGEWVKLANLFGILVGFSLLADHFDKSRLPGLLPRFLPGGARGCFVLLAIVWLLSGVLDNIAAAMIGATIAGNLFKRRVHLGYLAAVVAAANAGGAGSVIGDTTTTMMWLDGVSPLAVLPAYVGAASALVVFGTFASLQQNRHAPLEAAGSTAAPIDGGRLGIVMAAFVAMVGTNVVVNHMSRSAAERFPFLAVALWLVLLGGALARPLDRTLLPAAVRNALFLLALILSASLMPVNDLPEPSWRSTLGLGFVSAVFDNIPLTKLALHQGGYDWALLAYSVGCGGSIMWFGSSAGVAVAGSFPEAKTVSRWLAAAWHIPAAFMVGFLVQYAARGWRP